MEIKQILEFFKVTLESNVVAAVKALQKTLFRVSLDSNKVEVTNPTILPKLYPVKVTNPSNYDRRLENISYTTKSSVDKLAKDLEKRLASIEKSLRPFQKIEVTNIKDVPIAKKIEISNPQRTVSVLNLFEIAKEVGKVRKSVEALKLNPTITVPDVIVPDIKIPEIKVPETKVVMDLKKLEELMSIFSDDPKKPLSVRLSDGEKFYEAIFEAVSGGTSRSYAYQDSEGNRTFGLVDGKRNVRVSQEDRWGLNHTQKIGNTTYLGQEDADGYWHLTKIVKTTGNIEMTYATEINNEGIANYTEAWDNRLTVTYDLYSIAF